MATAVTFNTQNVATVALLNTQNLATPGYWLSFKGKSTICNEDWLTPPLVVFFFVLLWCCILQWPCWMVWFSGYTGTKVISIRNWGCAPLWMPKFLRVLVFRVECYPRPVGSWGNSAILPASWDGVSNTLAELFHLYSRGNMWP